MSDVMANTILRIFAGRGVRSIEGPYQCGHGQVENVAAPGGDALAAGRDDHLAQSNAE